MSTSGVSSSSLYQQLNQYFQTRGGDQKQLGQALASGNLAAAKTAFNNIVSLGQSGPFKGGDPFFLSNRESDFTAIGKALQSGDLAGAQQAFTTLQNTFKSAVQPQPPSTEPNIGPEIVVNLGGGGSATQPSTAPSSNPPSNAGPEIILNLGSGGNSSTPEQITINIGKPQSNGEENVSISAGPQGSKPQEISLNLNPNSNEQIILNLLGASSSSTSAAASTNNSAPGGGLSVSA